MRLWKIAAVGLLLCGAAFAQTPPGTALTIQALAARVAADLNLSPSATADTTNAANITSGTLPSGRLPFPGVSALGGVQSTTGASHQWISGISTSGVPQLSQPDAADVSGLAASATTDTTNAANITSGILPAARVPVLAVTSGTIAGSTIAAMTCDGTANDNAAFATAVATGAKTILIPVTAAGCKITSELVPQSGQTISGLGGGLPLIKVTSPATRAFNLTGLNNVSLLGLKLDGTNAASGGQDFIRFLNTTNSRLIGSVILNGPVSSNACVLLGQTSTDNEISGNTITSCASGAAILGNNAGVTRNKIHHNTITSNGGFSVRLMLGANRNEVSNNIVSGSTFEMAVSLGAQYNRLIGNQLEGSGDNGISIVGDHNVINGNMIVKNAKAGIFLWGSFNTVTGNNLLDNNQIVAGWNCIGVGSAYGATAQHNEVKGNTCDDDQATPTQLGIGIITAPGTAWTASTAYSAPPTFVYYGLNTYLASGAGTSGATPPTCTTGTCSDDNITWTYQSTFLTQAGAFFNDIADNHVIRYAGTAPFPGATPPSYALNRNPDFLVSQVNLDSATPTSVTSGTLIIDGWRNVVSNPNQHVYQRTSGISLPGYEYALTMTTQTNFSLLTSSFFQIMDRIEGVTIGHLGWGTAAGLPLTLEACLNTTGITGKIPFTVDNGGGGGTFQTFITSFNVTATGTWQCFSQQIPAPPVGGSWSTSASAIGLRLAMATGAGSTLQGSYGWNATAAALAGPSDMAQPVTVSGAVVRVAAVHLYQAGTTYIPRKFSEELQLAERWYYSTFAANTFPHTSAGVAGALCTVNPVAAGKPSLFVVPRTKMFMIASPAPTITTYNPSASNANWRDVTAAADVTVSVDPAAAIGVNGVSITTSSTVATQGDALCIHATIDNGS